MFRHHASGLYLGRNYFQETELFEVKEVAYPDPQILFVLTKVD